MVNIIRIYDCRSGFMCDIGYIMEPIEEVPDCSNWYELCMWRQWFDKKPINLCSDFNFGKTDMVGVCFHDVHHDKYYLFASEYSIIEGNLKKIQRYIQKHHNNWCIT